MKTIVNILIIVIFVSCEGPVGEIGPSGKNSLVNIIDESPGTNCTNGGVRIEGGIDKDDNGTLGKDEVNQTKFVCKGETGPSGKNSLMTVITELLSVNCANGGIKIEQGLDLDSNSVLSPDEIKQTKYVCNGNNGLPSLTVVTEEPSGSNCLGGGQRTEVGLDANGNLELDASEIQLTKYKCYAQLIEYPAIGFYGDNILLKEKTEFSSRFNSLAAKVPKNGQLKIVIKAKVTGFMGWGGYESGTPINWVPIFDLQNFDLTLQSIEGDKACDLKIVFDKGEYTVEYYEFDATTPTMTKTIIVNY